MPPPLASKEKPVKRLKFDGLPSEWRLQSGPTYSQCTLQTCQLSKLPALHDNDGVLEPGPVSAMVEERYEQPVGLEFDDVDQADGTGSDDEGHAPVEEAALAGGKSTRCVSLRLSSNHLKQVERRAFEQVPYLVSLDLSTNHIENFDVLPGALPRLKTLSLRNNRLAELGPIAKLTTLRRLDLSFNEMSSLQGIERLSQLRMLLASGNQFSGEVPAVLGGATRLVVCDLSHNHFSAVPSGAALTRLTKLSTLRLAHNQLPPRAMGSLVAVLGRLHLRRLDLYGNPLASDEAYPDELLRVQPKLVQLDHMRQAAGELAAGMSGGAVSSRSVVEAIDAVANSALAQHAVQLEQQRAKHAALLETLLAQQAAAAAALDEYSKITNAKITQFKTAITEAKRSGRTDASVDKVLVLRQELLTNEKICKERYSSRMADSITAVREALVRLQGEV